MKQEGDVLMAHLDDFEFGGIIDIDDDESDNGSSDDDIDSDDDVAIVNLTPHPVEIVDADGEVVRVLESEGIARAVQTDSPVEDLDDIPMVCSTYGGTEGLPEPKQGVYLLVSMMTANAAKDEGRNCSDLLIPAGIVRDDDGQITGSTSLAYFSPPASDADSGMTTQLIKSLGEKKFTLSPWYIPDQYDSENEWTDAIELQEALWGYVRNGDRQIRLQHNRDIVVGEWVEAFALPFPWTVPMHNTQGQQRDITYPAGTILLGIVWTDSAWEKIKRGEITGLSIGGSAQRIEQQIGENQSDTGLL